MVYIPPTLAIQAGIGIFQGITGFIGDRKQDDRLRKQTEQDNRNRLLAFQLRTDQWKRRETALKKAAILDLEQLKANYQAAQNEVQRATESGLTRLADLSDDLIAQAEGRNRNLARIEGRRLATGQTGKTIRRLENLPKGEAGRATSFGKATQERAEGAYMFNQKRVREEARVYMDNLYRQQQQRNYDPGPVPFFEGFQEAPARTAGRNLFNSLLGTAGNFAGQLATQSIFNNAAKKLPGAGKVAPPNRSTLTSLFPGASATAPAATSSSFGGFGLANTNFSLPPAPVNGSFSSLFSPQYLQGFNPF
jgi:hypothetical protein